MSNLQGADIIRRSARLRGQGFLNDAIELIESSIQSIDSMLYMNAWLEAFKAAEALGDDHLTRKYAQLVAAEEPDLPSIQGYI